MLLIACHVGIKVSIPGLGFSEESYQGEYNPCFFHTVIAVDHQHNEDDPGH